MLTKPKDLPKSCKYVGRYKGVYKPRCSGGTGCETCWNVYLVKHKNKKVSVTDVTVILDRSGSMLKIRRAMEDGLREFIRSQKNQEDTCYFTLVQFDDQYEVEIKNQLIQQVKEGLIRLVPRGLTRLYDAIGKTIQMKKKQVYASDKVIFFIITDGIENDSREYSIYQVRELIRKCEEDGWQFMYLGEGGKKIGVEMGFKAEQSASYNYNEVSTHGLFQTVSQKLSTVRSANVGDDIEGLISISPEDLMRMNQ